MIRRRVLALVSFMLSASVLAACGGGGSGNIIPPPSPSLPGVGVFDKSSAGCTVSYDGLIFYRVPSGSFSPIDVKQASCGAGLGRDSSPVIPAWAKPQGQTQAIFIATSLQQAYSIAGMQSIETDAQTAGVPVTWMIANPEYLGNASLYASYHAQNGDDIESSNDPTLIASLQNSFPWFTPKVSVEGAGAERNIAGAIAAGSTAFWGITWDSQGTDGTWDMGAPWGSYCADPASYKRPARSGNCSLVAFEWTARDLTRGYMSGHTEFFSTDPDDLLLRAGFDVQGAATYIQTIADAYAAAGSTQPLVMMSQQESAENLNPGDSTVLAALYARAKADGMKVETLRQAAVDAATFSAAPRAVAFPSIPGGNAMASPVLGGDQTLYPATIDYHDNVAGMTFLAGHTTPTRVFPYALETQSAFNVPLSELTASQTPALTGVSISNGSISFAFAAPIATHYGVALWADPSSLQVSGPGVTRAGHAGVVITFDLQAGTNTMTFPCSGCTSSTFTYST